MTFSMIGGGGGAGTEELENLLISGLNPTSIVPGSYESASFLYGYEPNRGFVAPVMNGLIADQTSTGETTIVDFSDPSNPSVINTIPSDVSSTINDSGYIKENLIYLSSGDEVNVIRVEDDGTGGTLAYHETDNGADNIAIAPNGLGFADDGADDMEFFQVDFDTGGVQVLENMSPVANGSNVTGLGNDVKVGVSQIDGNMYYQANIDDDGEESVLSDWVRIVNTDGRITFTKTSFPPQDLLLGYGIDAWYDHSQRREFLIIDDSTENPGGEIRSYKLEGPVIELFEDNMV